MNKYRVRSFLCKSLTNSKLTLQQEISIMFAALAEASANHGDLPVPDLQRRVICQSALKGRESGWAGVGDKFSNRDF